MSRGIQIAGGMSIFLLVVLAFFQHLSYSYASASASVTADWPMYMGTIARSGFNGAETKITPATAPNLKEHWAHKAGGPVWTQPVIAMGTVYWGSMDGVEHATSVTTGKDIWATPLGTAANTCHPTHPFGVISSASVTTLVIKGVSTPVILVGGGDVQVYALNALTGAVIWKTSLGTQIDHFLYGSPAVYQGYVYIGVSSHGDCPLIQGQLVQLRATTGQITGTVNVVPNGCTGGSIWVTPSIDTATNMLYISTGNEGTCSTFESLADGVLKIHVPDLALVDSWRVPTSQEILDDDFGGTPTLFTATIGGIQRAMVGLVNKNGIYYAFDRNALSAGPLWSVRVASPPGNGVGDSVSSSAWDGKTLYEAGSSATINGQTCAGHLRAISPVDGTFLWQDCLSQDVLGVVTAVPGVVDVSSGSTFILANTQNGKQLFAFPNPLKTAIFEGPGSIANGVLYHGNTNGMLYAFGL